PDHRGLPQAPGDLLADLGRDEQHEQTQEDVERGGRCGLLDRRLDTGDRDREGRRQRTTTRDCSARRWAEPGLTTAVIRRNRSSNGAKALLSALSVSHSISPRPIANASSSAANSLESVTPLIRRLSVLSVTRKRRRRRRSMGCFSIEGAAPVCTFDVG